LNYKMQILANDVPKKIEMTLISDVEVGLLHFEELDLIFKSESEEILDEIKKHLSGFFIRNNFGKRQSKGLGCFTIKDTTKDGFEKELHQFNTDIYVFGEEIAGTVDFYTLITRKWRTLKSGTQIGRYIKSKLFKYMAGKGSRWEKRLIKVNIYDSPKDFPYPLLNTNGYYPLDASLDEKEIRDNESYFDWDDNPEVDFDYFFIRALLGLPELYEFRTTNNNIVYQVLIKGKDGVERFKSPVTFKLFEKKIYAIVESIPGELLGSKFNFDVVIKTGDRKSDPINLIENLPVPREFDLHSFLRNYFQTVGFTRLTN
jgi:hypothetical protein